MITVDQRQGQESKLITFVCEGTAPLIMSRPSVELMRKLGSGNLDIASDQLYREDNSDPSSPIGIPARLHYRCLMHAGKYIKLTDGRRITNSKASLLPGFLHIVGFTPLTGSKAWYTCSYRLTLDGKEYRAPHRPCFDEWGFELKLVVDLTHPGVNEDTITALVQIAGEKVGLCTFSPAFGGEYGTFRIVKEP